MQFNTGEFCAQFGPFALRFLHPVFAEHALALLQQRADLCGIMRLADRDQGHIGGMPLGNTRSLGNAGADGFKRSFGIVIHDTAL